MGQVIDLNIKKAYLFVRRKRAEFMSLKDFEIDGTIAQPAYDAPSHYRQYDAFIVTDNWQDIIDGGYLSDPESNPQRTLFRP